MAEALSFFNDQDFAAAAYGGGFQYGNPSFDTKQLFAQMTINPNITVAMGRRDNIVAREAAFIANLVQSNPSIKDDIKSNILEETLEALTYTDDELLQIESEPLHSWFQALSEETTPTFVSE